MIRLHFGPIIANEERNMHYFLRAWGGGLEAAARGEKVDFKCLRTKRGEILRELHTFRFILAEAIQAGKIGSNANVAEVEKIDWPGSFCTQ